MSNEDRDIFDRVRDLEQIQIELNRVERMYEKLVELNEKCEDNMRRLNAMMLELKGIVAMVRPQVKKSGWYGEEIQQNAQNICTPIEINMLE